VRFTLFDGSVADAAGSPMKGFAQHWFYADGSRVPIWRDTHYLDEFGIPDSLGFEAHEHAVVRRPGDTRRYTFSAAAGQSATIVVVPAGGMAPAVTLFRPDGTVLATAAAPGPGRRAVIDVPSLEAAGYDFVVDPGAGVSGRYSVDL